MTICRKAKPVFIAALTLPLAGLLMIHLPRASESGRVASAHRSSNGCPIPQAGEGKQELPPLPAGVTELKFGDFFVNPVGDRGLVLTDKLKKLDGQRVRILGYMARQEAQPPGTFLLTPFPVEIHDHDNGLADDLPASTVHVFVPYLGGRSVPFTPQLLLLTGVLSLGNREEADGRISVVRLTVDPPVTSTQPEKKG